MASSNEERPARHAGSIVDPSVREDGIGEPHVELVPPAPPADAEASAASDETPGSEPNAPPRPDVSAVANAESRAAEGGDPTDGTDDTADASDSDGTNEAGGATSSDDMDVAGAPRSSSAQRRQPGHTLLRSRSPRGQAMRDRLLEKARLASSVPTPVASPDIATRPDPEGFSSLRGVEHALDQVASRARPGDTRPVRVAGAELSPNALAVFGTLFGLATVASLFAALVHLAPRGAHLPPPKGAATVDAAPPPAPQVQASSLASALPAPAPAAPKGPWRIETSEKKPTTRVLKGKIGSSPFLRAIQDAGLTKNQAYRVFAALKEEKNLNRCRSSDEFIALIERASSRVLAFEYVVSSEEVYQAREDDSGSLVGKRLDMKVVKRRVQAALQITDTFAAAARSVGLDASLSRVLDRALEGHMSTSELGRGDVVRVVAVEVTVLDQFSRYDGVEALEVLPAGDGKPTRIYYFPGPSARYVDARGRAPGLGEWARPVKNAPVTSKFNPKRFHPILKRIKPHTGTDFGAPTGTPILAVKDGTLSFIGAAGPNGNYVAIRHRGGYESGYSHLSRFEAGLKAGDTVRKGQVIGYVGTTGRSTGPHLHFSVKKDGKFIDPESLSLGGLSVLPRGEREQLKEVRAKYDPLLDAIALPEALAPASAPAASAAPPSDDTDDMETPPQAAAAAAFAPPPLDDPPEAAAPMAPAPPSPARGAAPTAASTTTAPALTPARPSSLYLSDKELMNAQPSNDDGEVDE